MKELKKLIIKRLNWLIKNWTIKLEECFGRPEVNEYQLYEYVYKIHYTMQQLRQVKSNEYEYIVRGNKVYFELPHGHKIYITKVKDTLLIN